MLSEKLGTSDMNPGSANTVFPSFAGKDFDGNDVDSSIFANNAVTVINFWFNGCSPCVNELASDSEAAQYAAQIMAFPTTVFVDRQGNIVGEPIVGAINSDATMKEVNTRIDNIIAADEATINAVG